MNKIIVIGESRLEITLSPDGTSGNAKAGGILLRAACEASRQARVMYISEIGRDAAGDIIVNTLTKAGVDCSLIDRFASPVTPLSVNVGDATVPYTPGSDDEGLDIAWPRIDRGDVMVFGGYFSIDPRIRPRLWQLLEAGRELGATMVYVPDVDDRRITRVTRIMPQVFENLEMADTVVALDSDLKVLYGSGNGAAAYDDHIGFYCRALSVVDREGNVSNYGSAEGNAALSVESALAGILVGLADR